MNYFSAAPSTENNICCDIFFVYECLLVRSRLCCFLWEMDCWSRKKATQNSAYAMHHEKISIKQRLSGTNNQILYNCSDTFSHRFADHTKHWNWVRKENVKWNVRVRQECGKCSFGLSEGVSSQWYWCCMSSQRLTQFYNKQISLYFSRAASKGTLWFFGCHISWFT